MKVEKKTIIWSAISVVVFIVIGIILWNVFKTEDPKLSKETQQLKGFTASVLASVNKYNPTEYSADTMKKELIETVTLEQVKYKSDSVGVSTLNIMEEINSLTGTSEEILNEIKMFLENFDVEGLASRVESVTSKPTKVLTLRANTVCDTETIDDKYCLDGNNSRLSANVYVHDEESTKWAVLLHPFMTNGSIMYGAFGNEYKELGYNVLALDLRGFGNSSGKVAMGYLESLDTYDWLLDLHYNYEERYGVVNQPDTIIIHGISLGAATTLQLATNPDIAASEDNLTKLGVKVFYDDNGYTSMSGLIEDILVNKDMGSLAVILSSLGVDFEEFMKELQNALSSLGVTGLDEFNIDDISSMEEFFNEVTDFVNYIKTADINGVSDIPDDIKEKLKKYLPEDIYNSVFNSNLVVQGNKAITNTYGAFNFGSYVDKGVGTTVTNTVGTGLNSINYSTYSNSFSSGRTVASGTKVVVATNENDKTVSSSNAKTVAEKAGEEVYIEGISSSTSKLYSSGSISSSGAAKTAAAATGSSNNNCTVKYDTAIKMIQESMRAYYIRGTYLQYNHAKHAGIINGYVLPEEATSQDNRYLVCTGFVSASLNTAFGIHYQDTIKKDEDDKYYVFEGYYALLKYAKENWSAGKLKERNKIIFYGTKNKSSLEFEDLVEVIKPGDIFVYSGHTMLAYDIIEVNGKKDVLFLHSWQGPYVNTKLVDTYRISYNNFPSTKTTDSFGAIDNYIAELVPINQGTVKQALLSQFTDAFINKETGKIQCQVDECAIIRPFYEKNGNTYFNFKTNNQSCAKTQLRMKYPNIKIEKTSSIGDKNVVSLGDTITYTIKVTNHNIDTKNNRILYENFYVEETIDEKVKLDETSIRRNNKDEGYTILNIDGKKVIQFRVTTLAPTITATFTYTVKIKDDKKIIGETIISEGKFREKNNENIVIETGKIENKIVEEYFKAKESVIEDCYEYDIKQNQYKGLAFVEATTRCVSKNYISHPEIYNDLSTFTFNKLINEKKQELKDNIYSRMVLNNYWNMTTNDNTKLPLWNVCTYKDTKKCDLHRESRAKTINPNDLKSGDILIYQEDSKLYSYIYVKNKGGFVDDNEKKFLDIGSESLYKNWGDFKKEEKEKLQKFVTYQSLFGKDYYVILRPSLLSSDGLVNLTK